MILITCFNVAVLAAPSTKEPEKKLLSEGVVLRGVDGKLRASEGDGEWVFELDADVNEAKAGTASAAKLNILPCGMLEAMVADANERSTRQFRLWASVTQYKGRNYVLPAYYLPMSKTDLELQGIEDSRQKTEDSKPTNHKPSLEDNKNQAEKQTDEVGIPTEIIKMIQKDVDRRRNTEDRRQKTEYRKNTHYAQNRVLVDVVGFVRHDKNDLVFVPDAVGRNIDKDSFRLLPCRALEQLERDQAGASEPVHFAVAGLITQYKSNKYLLLQRVIRVYSHGNFTN